MAVATRSLSQLVQVFTAAAQAACATALDFSVGSVSLAYAEAAAALGLWFQKLYLYMISLTRAQTSTGTDLDSWMAQWPLPSGQPAFLRLTAAAATGGVNFSRANTTYTAIIALGTQVQTGDGTQTFAVVADLTESAYSAAQNAYVIPAGASSARVTVQALQTGSAGNVGINTVTVLPSAVQYVDTISNPAAFSGGVDPETDPAFRARFALNLQGLASADIWAIEAAIANVQQGIRYVLAENVDYPGNITDYGNFIVIADQGAGTLTAQMQQALTAAINAVRGCSIRFQVFPPTILTATVSMTIDTQVGANHAVLCQQVEAALSAYIAALPLGSATLPITRLAQVAYDVSPLIGNVELASILINGQNVDLSAVLYQAFQPGVITVS